MVTFWEHHNLELNIVSIWEVIRNLLCPDPWTMGTAASTKLVFADQQHC